MKGKVVAYKSPLAQRIQREIAGNPAKREELVHWYEQFYTQFEPADAAELRAALGLEVSLRDVPFREIVPEGWLYDLLSLVKDSESPSPFYFLAALTVLSQAVGRKVMIDRGNHTLGLDISALLISPAGRGRRSTACDFVMYDIAVKSGINIIADSFTYEAFGDALVESTGATKLPATRMVENPHALIYAGEMSALLGKGSYGDSIIPKLTDIIGKCSRFEWRTVKRGGKIVFVRPMVNACFTSAPDWLVDNLPPVVFGGGMLSRFLISYQEQMERVVTWGAPISETAKEKVRTSLRRISKVTGVFERPTGDTFDWYDKWYQKHSASYLDGEIADERMAPYFSRKHDHLLRLTALLAIAHEDALVFTVERFEQAKRIIEWLELDVPKTYSQMALSPISAAQQMLVKTLERNGKTMDHTRLQRKMYRHTPLKEQFNAVVESLLDMGIIKKIRSPSGKGATYMLVRSLE